MSHKENRKVKIKIISCAEKYFIIFTTFLSDDTIVMLYEKRQSIANGITLVSRANQ